MIINASVYEYTMTPNQLFEEISSLNQTQQISFWTDPRNQGLPRIKIMRFDPMTENKEKIECFFHSFLHGFQCPFFVDYQILPWGPEGRWEIASLSRPLQSSGVSPVLHN